MKLGDAAVAVFQPISRGIDATLGTNIEHCTGCQNRPYFSQRALNRVSDELFALLSWRQRSRDTSPMDYTVTKQVSAQFVITGAASPEDAIEKAQKGEGQTSQGGESWNATLRQPPSPLPQVFGPAGPTKAP